MAVTGTLDAEVRRAAMAEELVRSGALTLKEAAERWSVHQMTVRRDFDAFVQAGIARRVRGGVVSIGGDDFSQRKYQNAGAKHQIALKLLDLVDDGAAVGLDSSTTVNALAEILSGKRVSALTNGLSAFQALHGRPGVKAYLTGGEREEENLSLVGSLAVESVRQFRLDVSFLSTMSVDPAFGTSELTLEQVAVKKAIVEASDKVVLAVDSSKFATKARFRSLSLADFDVMITELDPEDPRLDDYRDKIAEIR